MPSFATKQAISQTLQRNTESPRANKLREILLEIDQQLEQLTPESFYTLETIDQFYSLFLKEKAGKPFPENKKIINTAPIKEPLTLKTITINDAIELFKYPRVLGKHGKKIVKLYKGQVQITRAQ